jgi:Rieske Fe-S protein
VRTTRETRASFKPGDLRDYRKEGRFFLMADTAGIYAVTAVCTHNGCTVIPQGADGFGCPCHDSEYDLQGRVTQGPAKLPLRHFLVTEPEPGGFLRVDLSRTVDPGARL